MDRSRRPNSTDHSVRQPGISAEERALQANLLRNCMLFITQYNLYQGHLQQIINQLSTYTEEFLLYYREGARLSRTRIVPFMAGFGLSICISTFVRVLHSMGKEPPVNSQFLIAMSYIFLFVGLSGQGMFYKGRRTKLDVKNFLLQNVENALRRFSTAADAVISPLKNICNHAERILQLHADEDLGRFAAGLSQLIESLNPEDLLDLSGGQEEGRLDIITVLDMLHQLTVMFFYHFSTSEDIRALRDFDKLGKPPTTLQEIELDSEAGRLVSKMRGLKNQLQDWFNKLGESGLEVERVIVRRFLECFNQ